MSGKKLSRVRQYRRNSVRYRPADKTYEVKLPSGSVWTLRKPNLESFIVSGVLPLSLLDKVEKAKNKGAGENEVFNNLSVQDQIKAIEFSTKLVRYICVDPLIVDNPENENEIAPDEILTEDFTFLFEWANSTEGGEAEGLETFSAKR